MVAGTRIVRAHPLVAACLALALVAALALVWWRHSDSSADPTETARLQVSLTDPGRWQLGRDTAYRYPDTDSDGRAAVTVDPLDDGGLRVIRWEQPFEDDGGAVTIRDDVSLAPDAIAMLPGSDGDRWAVAADPYVEGKKSKPTAVRPRIWLSPKGDADAGKPTPARPAPEVPLAAAYDGLSSAQLALATLGGHPTVLVLVGDEAVACDLDDCH